MRTVHLEINKKGICKLIIVFLLICVWVCISGIGKLVYQNSDHTCRNTIFNILVESEWPCMSIDGKRGLIYYIGFWLPAAVFGKIFGLQAGYIFQIIWAIVGIMLFYILLSMIRGKINIWPFFVFVFFSGLDYLGAIFNYGFAGVDISEPIHLEWWSESFQFTANTTQLFWVFNQALPIWLIVVLVLLQKNGKNVYFIISFAILTSTFPFVGVIPIALYITFSKTQGIKQMFSQTLSVQNVIGVFSIGVFSVLYLMSNSSSQRTRFIYKDDFGIYITFIIFEVGIYFFLLFSSYKKNSLYYVILVTLLLCPFIIVGYSADFCMRVSIPALVVLNILCIQELENLFNKKKITKFIVFVILLLIGAITPLNEIRRTIKNTKEYVSEGLEFDKDDRTKESILNDRNFSGYIKYNFFFNYLAK